MKSADSIVRKGRPSRRRRIGAVVTALAAVAIAVAPTGSAKPPASGNKVFDICLQFNNSPDCTTTGMKTVLPGGTTAALTLTITNDSSSSTTLGSVNFDAPTALPLDKSVVPAVTSPSTGTVTPVDKSGTGGELQIRNLSLPIGGHATVTFSVKTPCAGSNIAWPTPAAKQSNNFLGTGNDFSPGSTTGMTSDIASGGCYVAFLNQPADTQLGSTIKSGIGSTGDPIQVGLFGSSGLLQTCPTTSCAATIALSADSPAATLNGGTPAVAFTYDGSAGGLVATFSSLSITGIATANLPETFRLTASAVGTTDTSQAFQIVLASGDCTASGCTVGTFEQPVQLGGAGDSRIYITTDTGYQFVTLNPFTFGGTPPSGCNNFISLNTPTNPVSGFAEFDGRSTTSGGMTITYFVPQKAIKARFGQNVGQQFIPICVGAKPVVNGVVKDCQDVAGSTGSKTGGWRDDTLALSSDGLKSVFTGAQDNAVCNADGYYWGIIGSFQDPIDPTVNPLVTHWDSTTIGGTTYRYFVMSVPSNWDYRGGC